MLGFSLLSGGKVRPRRGLPEKAIINFSPQFYTSTIAANLTALKALPIKGILLDLTWTSTAFGLITAQKSWLYPEAMAWSDFSAQVDTLGGQNWGTLTENFLRLRLQPGVDSSTEFWNDQDTLEICAANAALLAEAGRKMGCRGIVWDIEAYSSDIQHKMLDRESLIAGYTDEEENAQVRAGMALITRAIYAAWPDCVLFGLFGYEQAYNSADYELLPHAIDGKMDGLSLMRSSENPGIAAWHNGFEDGYFTNTEADFKYVLQDKAFEAHRAAGGTFHPLYARSAGFSMGIWVDRVSSAPYNAFSNSDFTNNYYHPTVARDGHASWQQEVELALRHSDTYVWIFAEQANGFPGCHADYHTATADALAAYGGTRTRYPRRILAYVSAAQRSAANDACEAIGLDRLFDTALIGAADAVDASATHYLADLKLSEAEYRGIRVIVGASATVAYSGNGDFDDSSQVDAWLIARGLRLAGTAIPDTTSARIMLEEGSAMLQEGGDSILKE